MVKKQELPNNWEAGIGQGGENRERYTKPFYNPKNDLELEQYTDPNEPHTITIHKVIRDEHGGVDGSELVTSATAETEEKADQKALELMRKYDKGV